MVKKLHDIDVGRTIAKYRKSKGLTQEVVAEILDISNEAVSRIERGIVMPTVARLIEFAEIFDCQAADLLTQSSHRPDDQTAYIGELLAKLDTNDRKLLVETIEKWAQRLARD